MTRLIIGLGSNLGNRVCNLEKALKIISSAFALDKVSSVYSTRSMLKDGQPDYYNMVCSCFTGAFPEDVLYFLQDAEKRIGRVKNTGRWGPRVIDMDILDYGGSVIKTDRLEIPHPGMALRSFVLYPLGEIAPDYRHPVTGFSPEDMIDGLKDDLGVTLAAEISFRPD